MRPLRVFLCHASQDKPAVWKLHRYLKQRGVQPWLDQADLLPGQNWEVEIPKAIYASDVILVCISKNSVNKEGYVQKEIVFALDKAMEKPEGTIFIIPVKLEECEIPRRLSMYHWVDYYRPDGRKRLLMGLNKRVTELGDEVMPVMTDDSKPRTPRPRSPKAVIKQEEPIVSVPVLEELKEESNKEIPVKPFTKLLDPSSLSPKAKPSLKLNVGEVRRFFSKNGTPWLWLGGIIVIGLVLFGLNAAIKNQPTSNITEQSTKTHTATLPTKTPTSTYTSILPTYTTTITPTATPILEVGSTMISEKDGMVLVYVPAGEFLMGSTDADPLAEVDEKPQHTVMLDAFWIDQTEVTNAMYARCVAVDQCKSPLKTSSSSHTEYFHNPEFANYPVIYVSWNDANSYCSYVGRRLPSEAEWEKAARGTDARIYPWGNDEPTDALLNYNHNINDTTDVGNYLKGASVYGSLDMAGNVWEWVNDWYDANYYRSSNSSNNPLGPESGKYKALRGGSWNGFSDVRSADRLKTAQSLAVYYAGFRCASSP